MPSFTPWRIGGDYPGGDAPYNITSLAGPQPFWRDSLDYARSGWRATPEAQYPDGYLGTLNTRRQDRLLDGLKQRERQARTRGVHKGEKMDARQYFWPAEFNPLSALQAEAQGLRFVSPGMLIDYDGSVLVNEGKRGPRGVPTGGTAQWSGPSIASKEELARLAPPWGTPAMGVPYSGR